MGFYYSIKIVKFAQQHKKIITLYLEKFNKIIKFAKIKRSPNKNETIEDYIGYCEYLLDDMQLLEMNILVL
jgi:hypothetical protein